MSTWSSVCALNMLCRVRQRLCGFVFVRTGVCDRTRLKLDGKKFKCISMFGPRRWFPFACQLSSTAWRDWFTALLPHGINTWNASNGQVEHRSTGVYWKGKPTNVNFILWNCTSSITKLLGFLTPPSPWDELLKASLFRLLLYKASSSRPDQTELCKNGLRRQDWDPWLGLDAANPRKGSRICLEPGRKFCLRRSSQRKARAHGTQSAVLHSDGKQPVRWRRNQGGTGEATFSRLLQPRAGLLCSFCFSRSSNADYSFQRWLNYQAILTILLFIFILPRTRNKVPAMTSSCVSVLKKKVLRRNVTDTHHVWLEHWCHPLRGGIVCSKRGHAHRLISVHVFFVCISLCWYKHIPSTKRSECAVSTVQGPRTNVPLK